MSKQLDINNDLSKRDRLIWSSLFLSDHFLGKTITNFLFSNVRKRSQKRMLNQISKKGKGKFVPIERVSKDISPEENSALKFIGHQANLTMLESVCRLAEISPENHLYNVNAFGNGGAAGAPSVLSQRWEQLVPGERIGIAIVGAGLTWGGVFVEVKESA